MKDDRIYIAFILECIADIQSYTRDGRADFLQDKKTQDAVLRKLHTLTESVQRLSPQLKSKYPAIDWKSITGFRNIIVHDYLGIDLIQVWNIVANNLPELKSTIIQIKTDKV